MFLASTRNIRYRIPGGKPSGAGTVGTVACARYCPFVYK
jgi:hypothetical protein